jgi:hypothetical protein
MTTLAVLSGCGLYTNVPAIYNVAEVKPASITYEKADTDGYRALKVEPAEVTLISEPGSIGATFSTMTVKYFSHDGKTLVGADLPTINTSLTVHLQSSNYPSDPHGTTVDQSLIGKATFVGRATTTLPIVSRWVENYGLKAGTVNAAIVTAEVMWSGTDDAGFPTSVIFQVPITFHGSAGEGTAKP